jgi:hypothetical protein
MSVLNQVVEDVCVESGRGMSELSRQFDEIFAKLRVLSIVGTPLLERKRSCQAQINVSLTSSVIIFSEWCDRDRMGK